MRARALPAADAAPPARRPARSVPGPLPRQPRRSSSRNDDYTRAAGGDLADLDRAHASRRAGSLPRLSVRGWNADEETARRLGIEKEGAERVVDAVEADLHAIVEIGAVP